MSLPKLEDLKVKPGEPVKRAFDRLLHWARSFELIKGDPRIRFVQQGGRGTWVSADITEDPWTPHGLVIVAGLTATVGVLTVNGLLPRLNGVPIDGKDEAGKLTPVPPLKLKPPADRKSWVCVQVKVSADGKLDPKDPTAITITHVASLTPPDALTGLQPLALLDWGTEGKAVAIYHQITMHHLKHLYVPGDPLRGRASGHYFSAV